MNHRIESIINKYVDIFVDALLKKHPKLPKHEIYNRIFLTPHARARLVIQTYFDTRALGDIEAVCDPDDPFQFLLWKYDLLQSMMSDALQVHESYKNVTDLLYCFYTNNSNLDYLYKRDTPLCIDDLVDLERDLLLRAFDAAFQNNSLKASIDQNQFKIYPSGIQKG